MVINKTNSHWLYLKVLPQSKIIQLRDSLGISKDNRVYMSHMLRYYLYVCGKNGIKQTIMVSRSGQENENVKTYR